MKQLLSILLLACFLTGCKNSNEVKTIEMLTYYTNAKDFKVYSTTDSDGFTQILSQSETSEAFVDNYQVTVRKSIMDSIKNTCRNANDETFHFKKPKGMWYCGDWHSVRITYENGEEKMFRYPYAGNENRQFIAFQSLSRQIRNDSLRAARLNIGQLGQLYTKQKDLSDGTFKQDSIDLKEHSGKHK